MSNYPTAGYVYLIRSDSGHYKIGKAKDPDRRVGQFTLQLPFKIEVICTARCDNHHRTERFLHRAFNQFHVNGEWFALPPLGVIYFEYLARVMGRTVEDDFWDAVCNWSQKTFDEMTHEALNDPVHIKWWVGNLLEDERCEKYGVLEMRGDAPSGF